MYFSFQIYLGCKCTITILEVYSLNVIFVVLMLYFSIFYYNRFGVVKTLGQYFLTSSHFVFDISLQQYWWLYLFCFAQWLHSRSVLLLIIRGSFSSLNLSVSGLSNFFKTTLSSHQNIDISCNVCLTIIKKCCLVVSCFNHGDSRGNEWSKT